MLGSGEFSVTGSASCSFRRKLSSCSHRGVQCDRFSKLQFLQETANVLAAGEHAGTTSTVVDVE